MVGSPADEIARGGGEEAARFWTLLTGKHEYRLAIREHHFFGVKGF
jgi:hypothetical protein